MENELLGIGHPTVEKTMLTFYFGTPHALRQIFYQQKSSNTPLRAVLLEGVCFLHQLLLEFYYGTECFLSFSLPPHLLEKPPDHADEPPDL